MSRGVRTAIVATAGASLACALACEFSSATGAGPNDATAEGGSAASTGEPGSGSGSAAGSDTGGPGDGRESGDTTHAALDDAEGSASSSVGDTSTSTGTAADDDSDADADADGSSTGEGMATSLYCDSPVVSIPDDDSGGVATQILVPDAAVVLGVRVRLDVTHTHVGDLRIDLRHGQADRLLVSYPGSGTCSGDDILARLTDDAVDTVQTACTGDTPALTGDLRPEYSLDAFVGLPMLGAWELRATDGGPMDTGTIVAWCLEIDHLP